ncbi:hypothetical protein P4B35_17735 [Pontiellaceae bacterium B12227]|nr:hypothetical protein [Pontiellaceae bacterium B12227]
MKKTLSIAAVALLVAGSTAFACGSSCGKDKADKETAKSTAYNAEQTELACGGSKKAEKNQTACGGSKKGDDSKKTA